MNPVKTRVADLPLNSLEHCPWFDIGTIRVRLPFVFESSGKFWHRIDQVMLLGSILRDVIELPRFTELSNKLEITLANRAVALMLPIQRVSFERLTGKQGQ